jgi:nitroreductase/NAD-dependent dihydropyrimidine dehydrogenase PreA subunit
MMEIQNSSRGCKVIPVELDKSKCTGCGLCVDVCPEKVFFLSSNKVSLQGQKCMACGHCQAACPTNALNVAGITELLGLQHVVEILNVTPPGEFNSKDLVQLMRSRRSCRNYLPDEIELSLLQDLVKIGTTAPSGTNSQSWKFTLLPSRKDVEALGEEVTAFYGELNRKAANPLYRLISKLLPGDELNRYYDRYYESVDMGLKAWTENGEDSLFHGAVSVIVVMGERTASCPAEDALLATQNILLAAHSLGLGSCLIGFAVEAIRRRPAIRKLLKMKESCEVYSVIGLGYPAECFYRPAGRKIVKPTIVNTTCGTYQE